MIGMLLGVLTLTACTTPVDPNRFYASKSPEQCASIRFACPAEEEPFFDNIGCGCERKNPHIAPSTEEAIEEGAVETPKACTREYQPVCGTVQVQCITTPCDPMEQTFPNRCTAEASKAVNIEEGACKSEILEEEELNEEEGVSIEQEKTEEEGTIESSVETEAEGVESESETEIDPATMDSETP